MGPFAWDKMVLIFIVVLVLFGPKELPKVAKTIATFMNDFKRASSELKETWQRELSALEQETQEIRKDLTAETDKLTQSGTGSNESYYHHDSSYDYGAYGYPDSSSEAATAASVAAAGAVTEAGSEAAVEGPAVDQAAETATETDYAGSAPAPAEAVPVVAAAEGTVPTDVSTTPATDAHDEPAAS
jgi:TatA/E family protein of Tat protein translocase